MEEVGGPRVEGPGHQCHPVKPSGCLVVCSGDLRVWASRTLEDGTGFGEPGSEGSCPGEG